MKMIYTALLIVLGLAVALFCIQNLRLVPVSYLGGESEVPLAALVLVVYVLGMFTGGRLFAFIRRSYRGATQHSE